MDENTVTGKLVNGGNPQELSREIIGALAETGKFGYQATFDETGGQDDQLTIDFTCKSRKQALIIPGCVWRHRGGIRQTIIDELKI
jgi:hypothetical protein